MIEDRIEMVDFGWSSEGDFILMNGDIYDTDKKPGEGFQQEVEDRIKSSLRDWKLYEYRGADIEEYHGELNNETTWVNMGNSLDYSLTNDNFLNRQDFIISIAPVSNTGVAIRIDFDTSLTDITPDSTISVKVAFDLNGQRPFIIR